MKRTALIMLCMMLAGCAKIQVTRLSPGSAGVDVACYTDVVMMEPKGNGIEKIAKSKMWDHLNGDGLYMLQDQQMYRDASDRLPLGLTLVAIGEKSETPIECHSYQGNQGTTYSYSRTGTANTQITFTLFDYRSGRQLYTDQITDSSKDTNSSEHASSVPAIDYNAMFTASAFAVTRTFYEKVFPHYVTTKYARPKCKHLPTVEEGLNYYEMKSLPEAETALRQAVQAGQANPKISKKELGRAKFYLGLTLERQRKFDEAIGFYRQALATNPGNQDYMHAMKAAESLKQLMASMPGAE